MQNQFKITIRKNQKTLHTLIIQKDTDIGGQLIKLAEQNEVFKPYLYRVLIIIEELRRKNTK